MLSDLFFSGKITVARERTSVSNRSTSIFVGTGKKTYIRPRAAQVDNLGTAVAILLEAGALEAVKGVRDALAAAHDALVLVVAEAALVADAHQRRRAHVRVAHGTLAVALVAEAADGNAGLFAAHDEIAGRGRDC